MKIRFDKLPDPKVRPNTGSFFKNAIISTDKLSELQQKYPDIPHYNMPQGTYKIPTGWLIDRCGLKGTLHYGMRVHDKNALVLINESAQSYEDLAQARQKIIDTSTVPGKLLYNSIHPLREPYSSTKLSTLMTSTSFRRMDEVDYPLT